MRRRRILGLLGGTIASTAGCTLNKGSISITVQNFTSGVARVEIQLFSDDVERYSNSIEVPSGGKRHLENVADGSANALTVLTDQFGEVSRPISMNGCDEQEISVAILPSEKLDIQLKRC